MTYMKVLKNNRMIDLKHIVVAALIAVCSNANAQNWRTMLDDPNAEFSEIQAAFYAEFGDEAGAKGSGWKQFKRLEWFKQQRLDERGQMPNPRLIYQEVKRAEMQKEFRGTSGDWSLIGPIEEAQNDNGRSIGRVCAVAFHPTDSSQMWAGSPSGGLWKSTDNGLSWQTLTDELTNLGVSDIIINPQYPDSMYMSTGDGSSGDTYTYGVLRSTDGGLSWDTTGLSFDVSASRNIRRLILDSTHTNVLIAAATNGIYRTEDAGDTWTKVQSGNFSDLEFKPYNHDTVYATAVDAAVPFFISVDNGQSWTASSTGIPNGTIYRAKIAVTKADPNVIYMEACTETDYGHAGLYRSLDAGATWELRSDNPNIMNGDEFGAGGGGQGWYSMDIAVSQTDPNEIRVGGINLWKSIDGGATFQLEGHWFGANGTYVHADHHRLEYHPITGQFYTGCDGGLYRRSHYFNGFECISSEMSITQFYRIGMSQQDPTLLMAGAQDNGTLRWKEGIWSAVSGGDGMECFFNPENNDVAYASYQNGVLRKSTNGGSSFNDLDLPGPGSWVTPFMEEPVDPQVLYAPLRHRVYRSDDAGGSWYSVSPTLTTVSSGTLVAFDVAQTNTEYLVAAAGGRISITKDLGGSWQNITSGLPSSNITFVSFDPFDENIVWVTLSGYSNGNKVFRSINAGENWENMSMNLPNLPVNCIEIERSSTGGVYVGTDVGVYYWDREQTEWIPFMTGLPNVIVNELEILESENLIRAATFGRGIWESETRNFINVGIQEVNTDIHLNVNIWPNPASDKIQIDFSETDQPINFDILDAFGRVTRQNLNPLKKNNLIVDIQSLASGVYYLKSDQNMLIGRFIATGR